MASEATVGGILSELAALVGDAARDVALYVLVIGGLAAVGVVLGLTETATMAFSFGFQVNATDGAVKSLFDLVSAVVGVYGGYWLLTRLLAARGRYDGRGRFWAYFGLVILSFLGIGLGLLFVVVPGLILLVRWSAASGYLIGPGQSVMEALASVPPSWRSASPCTAPSTKAERHWRKSSPEPTA
jgi:hypothetical protein